VAAPIAPLAASSPQSAQGIYLWIIILLVVVAILIAIVCMWYCANACVWPLMNKCEKLFQPALPEKLATEMAAEPAKGDYPDQLVHPDHLVQDTLFGIPLDTLDPPLEPTRCPKIEARISEAHFWEEAHVGSKEGSSLPGACGAARCFLCQSDSFPFAVEQAVVRKPLRRSIAEPANVNLCARWESEHG
jgi:hypothetical protein